MIEYCTTLVTCDSSLHVVADDLGDIQVIRALGSPCIYSIGTIENFPRSVIKKLILGMLMKLLLGSPPNVYPPLVSLFMVAVFNFVTVVIPF